MTSIQVQVIQTACIACYRLPNISNLDPKNAKLKKKYGEHIRQGPTQTLEYF